MPCFDKKLEASRPDFYLDEAETREVDCVITSGTVTTVTMLFVDINLVCHFFYTFLVLFLTSRIGEVQKMLEEKNVSLNDVEPAPLDTL